MTTTPQGADPVATRDRPDAGPSRHVGWIVAGSLTVGLVVGLLLVAAPFIEPEERDVTGALHLPGDAGMHSSLSTTGAHPFAVAPILYNAAAQDDYQRNNPVTMLPKTPAVP